MIVDARTLDGTPTLTADIVIIGGGVAGITMAMELERAGVDTIVLESGGCQPDPATRDLHRGVSTDLPYLFADGTRSRYLGGSSNCWGGWCRPFDDWDFEPRDWVAHSGWPIGTADVAPYYPRTHDYLDLGPFDYDLERFVAAIGRSDVRRMPLPTGRVVDSMSQFSPPTRFGAKYLGALAASRLVRTVLHANVVEIDVDDDGRVVRRVRCRTLTGKQFSARGRAFVLAAGGIENPRLLHASNRVQRCGLGNDRDLVGRFFMDHPRLFAGSVSFRPGWGSNKLFDAKFHDRTDVVKAFGTHFAGALALSRATQERERLANARLWFSSIFPGEYTDAADATLRIRQRREQKVPPGITLAGDLRTVLAHPVDAAGFALTRRWRPARPRPRRQVPGDRRARARSDGTRHPLRQRQGRARAATRAGGLEAVAARATHVRPHLPDRRRRAAPRRRRRRRARPTARRSRRLAGEPEPTRHVASHGHHAHE